MTRQAPLRIRVDDQGALEIVDPGWDCLGLLQSVEPEFQPRREPLPGFVAPRFLRVRGAACGHSVPEIEEMPLGRLWIIHADAMNGLRGGLPGQPSDDQATLLDVKIEIARRLLTRCTLCAHCCGVDRTAGEIGVCRLGTDATVAEHFVHIGEEAPINPSLVLNLAGCGLRCRYCQQGAILDPAKVNGERLDGSLWPKLDSEGARSLSFVGGNPDESLYAILRFLASAPHDWSLPIVWNSHAYATPETLVLLDGLVDAFVPDYKYGNKTCGLRLSGARDYPTIAAATIGTMLTQEVPVIVRILVLPGHVECCHRPTLEALADLRHNGTLLISVRGQYCPDWRIGPRDGALTRRATAIEIEAIHAKAETLGLLLAD